MTTKTQGFAIFRVMRFIIPNRIIGDLRNPTAKPFTFCQSQLYSAKDALLPSGLMGPVELRAVSDLPVSTAKR